MDFSGDLDRINFCKEARDRVARLDGFKWLYVFTHPVYCKADVCDEQDLASRTGFGVADIPFSTFVALSTHALNEDRMQLNFKDAIFRCNQHLKSTCSGTLRLSFHEPSRKIVLRYDHVINHDRAEGVMPDAIRSFIVERAGDLSYRDLLGRLARKHFRDQGSDSVPEYRIRYLYKRVRMGISPHLVHSQLVSIKRAVQLLESGVVEEAHKVILDYSSDDVMPLPSSYTCRVPCFGFTTVLGHDILAVAHPTELFLDGTVKICRDHFEMYAVLVAYNGMGFPIGYLFVDRKVQADNSKVEPLTAFFQRLRAEFPSLSPDFCLTDKCHGQIRALSTVFNASTVQLCYYHMLCSLRDRARAREELTERTIAAYRADNPHERFPFLVEFFPVLTPKTKDPKLTPQQVESFLYYFRYALNAHETFPHATRNNDGTWSLRFHAREEYYAETVRRVYEWCHSVGTSSLWVYVWSNWLTPSEYALWSLNRDPVVGIPVARTTSVSESHFSHVKELLRGEGRIDVARFVERLCSVVVPRHALKFLQQSRHGIVPRSFREKCHDWRKLSACPIAAPCFIISRQCDGSHMLTRHVFVHGPGSLTHAGGQSEDDDARSVDGDEAGDSILHMDSVSGATTIVTTGGEKTSEEAKERMDDETDDDEVSPMMNDSFADLHTGGHGVQTLDKDPTHVTLSLSVSAADKTVFFDPVAWVCSCRNFRLGTYRLCEHLIQFTGIRNLKLVQPKWDHFPPYFTTSAAHTAIRRNCPDRDQSLDLDAEASVPLVAPADMQGHGDAAQSDAEGMLL